MSLHNHSSFIALQGVLCDTTIISGEYTLISDGNQYIDTGYVPTGNSVVYLKSKYDNVDDVGYIGENSNMMFGMDIGTSNFASLGGIFGVGSRSFYFDWADSASGVVVSANTDWNIFERRISGTKGIYYNGVLKKADTEDYTGSASVYLFGANIGGVVASDQAGIGRITDFSGTEADGVTPYINLKPVPQGSQLYGASTIAPSNCMYDVVSDTYFENQGTGSFAIELI